MRGERRAMDYMYTYLTTTVLAAVVVYARDDEMGGKDGVIIMRLHINVNVNGPVAVIIVKPAASIWNLRKPICACQGKVFGSSSQVSAERHVRVQIG